MWKLIRLEYRQNETGKYLRNAVILAGLLILFLFAHVYLGISNDPDTGRPDAAAEAMGISANVELLTGIAWMIFSAAMHAGLIIGAYKNRTMQLLFTYPVPRKKILAAKMAASWLFCLTGLVTTKLLAYGVIRMGSQLFTPAFLMDYSLTDGTFYLMMFIKSVMTVSISFMALYAGLLMKSSKAAMIASFLLIILMQGNVGGVTLRNQAALPLMLTALSFVFAGLSVLRADGQDV